MAVIASSITWPLFGLLALAWIFSQRESAGTQKMFLARYSSGSSGSAPSSISASSSRYRSWKASEMYLRKMRPSTTCLYSAASMLFRNLSAAAQSVASNPRSPPFFEVGVLEETGAFFEDGGACSAFAVVFFGAADFFDAM